MTSLWIALGLIAAGHGLAATASPDLMFAPQDRAASDAIADQDVPPVQLDDIVVTGRPLNDIVSYFVTEVAEPNAYRGLARWESRICVGVVNLRNDMAQHIVDRVSTIGADLGLTAGEPGCVPNILIVATGDGSALAEQLVETRGRAFRLGGGGMDRGRTALRDFVETDRPVRWWQVSAPIDSETGRIATRLPGESAPIVGVFQASRIRTQIVDRLLRTLVIVDVDDVAGLSIDQLADYVAMVSLAQIDPDADTDAYATILNVLDRPEDVSAITTWDQAYLAGIYAAEQSRINRRANRSEIVRSIVREHAQSQAQSDIPSGPLR